MHTNYEPKHINRPTETADIIFYRTGWDKFSFRFTSEDTSFIHFRWHKQSMPDSPLYRVSARLPKATRTMYSFPLQGSCQVVWSKFKEGGSKFVALNFTMPVPPSRDEKQVVVTKKAIS